MAKVTKERLANICKRVNEGMKPSYATRAEGLGGEYLIALKDSGADNYKQESVKEECKLLYKAFHDHVGKLGSRIHNDPKLGEDE